jgi:hypothetical protein
MGTSPKGGKRAINKHSAQFTRDVDTHVVVVVW